MTTLFTRAVCVSVCENPDCDGEDFVGEGGKPLTVRPDGSVEDGVVVCTTCGRSYEIGLLDDGECLDVEYFDHEPPAGAAPMEGQATLDAERNY